MVDIPRTVRKQMQVSGATRWLDDLDAIIERIEKEWGVDVGRTYPQATESVVVEATLADGTPVVLKLVPPHQREAAANEMTVLRIANGAGCARLLRADAELGAMLLERLGPTLYELALPIGTRHEILCATAARLWRPAPGCGLPTGAEKADRLAGFITTLWEELDRPCSERVVDHALACSERRAAAHDDDRAVLVHGDVHEWNALQARSGDGDSFRLVDPDGLLAEAEYDMGIVMREDPIDLMRGDPRDRAHRLATITGLDVVAIWEWGVVERVSTGLLGVQVELEPIAHDMLAAAEVAARFGSFSAS